MVDVPDQADVEFDELGLKLEHVTQAGVARAGVVDGQLHVRRPRQRGPQKCVVAGPGVLGDLHDQRSAGIPQTSQHAVQHRAGGEV